eukprot:11629_6
MGCVVLYVLSWCFSYGERPASDASLSWWWRCVWGVRTYHASRRIHTTEVMSGTIPDLTFSQLQGGATIQSRLVPGSSMGLTLAPSVYFGLFKVYISVS